MFAFIALFFTCIATPLYPIYVTNTTNKTIYTACYCIPYNIQNNAYKASTTYTLPAQTTHEISRPPLSIHELALIERDILFSYNQNDLVTTLGHFEALGHPHTHIGLLQGEYYYITESNGVLKGYNFYEYYLVKPVTTVVNSVQDTSLELLQTSWQQANPYKKTQATVTKKSISEGEKQHIQQRIISIQNAIQTITSNTLIPPIGVAFSGGGIRSQLFTLGALKGLKDTGLLDTVWYISSLSGSMWALAPYLASPATLEGHCLESIRQSSINLLEPFFDMPLFNTLILRKLIFDEPVSVIDIFAMTLHRKITPMLSPLTSLENSIKKDFPYPLFSAIIADTFPASWIEFSPHAIGTSDIGIHAYTESWGFGRKYNKGLSLDYAPAQSLSFITALSSSGISQSFNEIITSTLNSAQNSNYALAILEKIITNTPVGDTRIAVGRVNNFTYGMQDSPLQSFKTLRIIDPGIQECNIPLPPLLRRNLQIYLIIDASETIEGAPELKKAITYAQRKGYKTPPIDYIKAGKENCSVFFDPKDLSTPIYIYIPRIALEQKIIQTEYLTTYANILSEKEAKTVFAAGYKSIKDSFSAIVKAIKLKQ